MKNLIIIGTSTTAEHVCRFVEEYNLFHVIGFAVDEQYKTQDTFLDKPLYSISQLDLVMDKAHDLLFVAMLWNRLNEDRRVVYERLKDQGFHFANLISPTAKIRGELLGDNCWFHDYTIVQYGTIIGTNVCAMAFSLIGAHVSIGAHCFLGAKSTVGGNCIVGEQCFIGIDSTIFDDRKIGNKCIIGATTAVKRDMADYTCCKTAMSNTTITIYSEKEIIDKLQFVQNKH